MCDALFFNKRAYENHNLFHKTDDVYIENEQQRYELEIFFTFTIPIERKNYLCSHRQTMVTRVDQDFDIRRVQTQAEKFLPKVESVPRGRKRKAQQANKQKSSSVRWVPKISYFFIASFVILISFSLKKSSSSNTGDAGNDSDCLSSASSVSDSEEEPDDPKPSENPAQDQIAC